MRTQATSKRQQYDARSNTLTEYRKQTVTQIGALAYIILLENQMTPPPKNHEKGDRYTYAFEQIERATAAGFFIEVVAICESIIMDRLQSNAVGTKAVPRPTSTDYHINAKKIISGIRKSLPSFDEKADQNFGVQTRPLLDDVEAWLRNRNHVIHSLVKSDPGSSPGPLDDFQEKARHSAQKGVHLARETIRWHEQQLRNAPNTGM